MKAPCPCGSGKHSSECCLTFISGDQQARTPLQLMRSRYSAYALGGYGEYLLETWLPVMTRNLNAETLSQKNLDWLGLSIIDKSQQGNEGIVEFKADYLDSNGQPGQLHERSVFSRIKGRWYYVGGEIIS